MMDLKSHVQKPLLIILISFFVNVGVSLASKFSTDTSKINSPVNEKKFNFKKVSVDSVKKQIFKLKNGKATGLDEIGTRLQTCHFSGMIRNSGMRKICGTVFPEALMKKSSISIVRFF